jgi:ribonuclease III
MPKNLLAALEDLEAKLGYSFKNKEILFQDFTHRSFLNEATISLQSNERLEFLGDSVLNLFVSEFLFKEFPEKEEGELSKLKAHLVCQESCFKMIQTLDVTDKILASKGEKSASSLINPTLAADLLEAIVGAIFFDGGWDAVASFLHQKFADFLRENATNLPFNPKAALQEFLAKQGKPIPEYHVLEAKGPSHQKEFTIAVVIAGTRYASGIGKTKKEAQQKAAELTLEQLMKELPPS